MVLCVRVRGDIATDIGVTFDDSFRDVLGAALLRVAVMLKQMCGTGRGESKIKSKSIVCFVADPNYRYASDHWQYGEAMGPAPPVVFARKDSKYFSRDVWEVFSDYMGE